VAGMYTGSLACRQAGDSRQRGQVSVPEGARSGLQQRQCGAFLQRQWARIGGRCWAVPHSSAGGGCAPPIGDPG
jgi:hypothetical protein